MIPPVPNLKDKLKQTSLRMHLEKDEKNEQIAAASRRMGMLKKISQEEPNNESSEEIKKIKGS